MKQLLIAALAITGLSGCTAVKATYQSNSELVAGIAASVTGPACAEAVGGLKPGEAKPACAALSACAQAICATPQGQ